MTTKAESVLDKLVTPEPPADPTEGISAPPKPSLDPLNAFDQSEGPMSGEERNAARSIRSENNPASPIVRRGPGPIVTEETRVPLNVPDRSLEVPPIEGYHLHWFLETNVPKAQQAGYEFVFQDEVPSAAVKSIGGRSFGQNSEEIGGGASDRIMQIAGTGIDNRPVMFVLMKIQNAWYFKDQRRIAARNYDILSQIFRKKMPIRARGESEADYATRYTKEAVIDMSNGRFRKVG